MIFLDALVKAKDGGYTHICRESLPGLHRGIRTLFSYKDQHALDWRVVKGKTQFSSPASDNTQGANR